MIIEKNKKPTITIGIPAFNEEANIGYLLKDLSEQEHDGFYIDRLIVASDGSTDRTADIVRNFSGEIILYENPVRQGVAMRQNQLMEAANSDILVILDADIRMFDRFFLKKLILPVIDNKADMASCNYLAIEPATLIGKALAAGLVIRNYMFARYRHGNNLYTCHGTARAFSARLYKSLRFKESIGEDAFSYLYAKSRSLKYAFVPDAFIYISLPDNLNDYLKQSIRFIKTPAKAGWEFSKEMIRSELKLPRIAMAMSLIRSFIINPFYTLVYFLLYIWTRFTLRRQEFKNLDWGIARSTKDLNRLPERSSLNSPGWRIALFFRNLCYRLISLTPIIKSDLYPPVFILCYHSIKADGWRFSVDPAEFKRQISWLLKNFQPLKLSEIEAIVAGRKKVERKSFALTFDDGYADNADVADFLNQCGIVPALFLLSSPESANRQELETGREMLGPENIKKIISYGWEIGCHSATHGDFSSLNENELKNEIIGAKSRLENSLGIKINYFSYPKGKYGDKALRLIKQAGYKLAVSMDDNIISYKSNLFALPRIGVDRTHRMAIFKIIFSRAVIDFRRIIKAVIKIIFRLSDNIKKKISNSGPDAGLTDSFGVWMKIKLFFVNRLVTEDRNERKTLPVFIKDYKLINTIYRPKGDDQYQFGIYENEKGEKGILKMWDGKKKDGDWFWLMNEINTYEGLKDLFRANEDVIKKKNPNIKLPRLLESIKDSDRLGLFVEMIEGETLDKEESVVNRAYFFEQVIEYFQYLGELIFNSGLNKKFVYRKNIHTILIFFYVLLRSAWMYPKIIPKLAYGFFLFMLDFPYLTVNRDMAFVHRDLTYMNVMKLKDGRIGVIDFELAVVTNPLYEITQAVTGSWHLENFCHEFYRLHLMRRIFTDKNKLHCYRALTIFTAVHRIATSPVKEFDSHYSYFEHGLKLIRQDFLQNYLDVNK